MIATQPVQMGKTDLLVTRLGLGTAPLGGGRHLVDDEQAIATVEHALQRGVRFLDTAPMYGAGRSESMVGSALRGVPRDAFVLSTKVGRLVNDDGTVVFDWTRDGILRSIEASLQRLQLDYVDILLIHDPDNVYQAALEVAYPVLDELRSQGVIKALGAGMNQWQMELQFARAANFDCFLLAGRYTLLEQEPASEFLPEMQQRGIGIVLGGVLNSGILATGAVPGATYNYGAAPPAVAERVEQLEAVCARHTVPLRIAAMHFPLGNPAVTTLLVGARSPEEVDAAIAALDTPVPAALWDDLRAQGLLSPDAPTPA